MSLILLILLGIFVALLAYILFVPIRVDLHLAYDGSFEAASTLAFFPFRRTFSGKRNDTKPEAGKPAKAPKPKEIAKEKYGSGLDFSKIDQFDRQIILKSIKEALRFIGQLIRTPDYYLRANIIGGSEEPDVTGQIYGAYMAVRPLLPQSVAIEYRPDFLMGVYRGEMNFGLSLRVYDIMKEITAFLFRIPTIKLYKLYRKLKRRNDDK
jgi:hypothetical protein